MTGQGCPEQPEIYEITVGRDGPVVAGPYAGYEVAIRARDAMRRTWRMILRGQHYWGRPLRDECAEPGCDGKAGHEGKHYQWVPE